MKKTILCLALLSLAACASSKKEDATTATQDNAETVAEAAKKEIENAAEDLKNATEDLKAAASETASAATEEVKSTTSFDSYAGTEASKITCISGEDVRPITVLNGESGGCGVVYNKFGEDKTVAVAKVEMDYCSRVQEKIKTNLEGAGFTCE